MPEIKNYAVRFHGGQNGSGDGVRAQIHLFDGSNHMVGSIDFYDNGLPLPADTSADQIKMAMWMQDVGAVIDILRNEKPVFLKWQEKIQNAYLGTSQEPVGEGE